MSDTIEREAGLDRLLKRLRELGPLPDDDEPLFRIWCEGCVQRYEVGTGRHNLKFGPWGGPRRPLTDVRLTVVCLTTGEMAHVKPQFEDSMWFFGAGTQIGPGTVFDCWLEIAL